LVVILYPFHLNRFAVKMLPRASMQSSSTALRSYPDTRSF